MQPSFFLLVLVRFILILLKLLQKVPKVQASEYLPTNLCALSVFLLLLCCNLSSHKMRGVYQRIKYAKNSLKLVGVWTELLSGMRGNFNYTIIIDKNWTKFVYVALVIKETITCILYNSPHFCAELLCLLNYIPLALMWSILLQTEEGLL